MRYDFNMNNNYYGHNFYEKWDFNDNEVEFLFDLFNLPIENEKILFTFDRYFDILSNGITRNIEKFLNKLPYNYFLESPYWRIISNYKKKISDNKCQICCSKNNLNTHHNNYKNKGKEYSNLNDLVVLCGRCHNKFHKEKNK